MKLKKITIKIIDEEKEDVCFNLFIDEDQKIAEVIGAEKFDPGTTSKEQNLLYSLLLPSGLMERYASEKFNKEDSLNVFCHKHDGLYPGLPENKSVAIHEKSYRDLNDKIYKFYFDDDGNELGNGEDDPDLIDIGECAASHFGWL